MHEMSIAQDVCRIARENLDATDLPNLLTVTVEVGDSAGIEPESLEFCLEVLLKEPPFGGARPNIMRVEGDTLRVSYLEVDDGSPDN